MLRTYHLAYNSGCYTHTDYRIQHIICVPAPSGGIRDCNWITARNRGIYAHTLLATGDTEAQLVAPGGPTISSSNQGVGDGIFYKNYIAFHADTNLRWFEDPDGEERVRSMFIVELEYNGQEDMVKVKDHVEPGKGNGVSRRE